MNKIFLGVEIFHFSLSRMFLTRKLESFFQVNDEIGRQLDPGPP